MEWAVSAGLTDYATAATAMERRAAAIADGSAAERVWLVEHPPLFTAGTSAGALPASLAFPLHRTGRGGQVTYHGPGQRIAYVMLDLGARRPDLRAFVTALERWIIDALSRLAVQGEQRDDRVGVWVTRPDKTGGSATAEDKIAAIGIRVRRWVSFHGVAINVAPDLSHYAGIVPCGIADPRFGLTSLAELGRHASLHEVDDALRSAFEPIFGATRPADMI